MNNIPNDVALDLVRELKKYSKTSHTTNDLLSKVNNYLTQTDWFNSLSNEEKAEVKSKGVLQLLDELEGLKPTEITKEEPVQIPQSTSNDIGKNQKQRKSIFSRNNIPYILELIAPSLLSVLYFIFVDSKNDYFNSNTTILYADEICWVFGVSFFLIVIAEWKRRRRITKPEHSLVKYAYIGLMLFVFLLGIWFANMLVTTG